MKRDPVGRNLTDEAIADFRTRLCDAAEAKIAEGGRTAVNMRGLAERLGVSAMTPYRYFESKQAMINAVRARAAMTRGLQRSPQGLRRASDAQVAGDLFWATLHGLLALGMGGKLPDCESVRAVAVAALSRGLTDRLAAA